MITPQTFVYIVIFAVAILLISGAPALINMLINDAPSSEPYPKLVALTPIAIFLIVLGVAGAFLVYLCSSNFHNGNGNLAKKQFFIGFSLLFLCYVGLEFLLNFGLK